MRHIFILLLLLAGLWIGPYTAAIAGGSSAASTEQGSSSHASAGSSASELPDEGLVLGLTVAEWILLVIFSLTLAAAIYYLFSARMTEKPLGVQILATVIISSCSILLCSLMIGMASVTNLISIGKELKEISDLQVPLVEKMTKMVEHQMLQTIYMERYLRTNKQKYREKFMTLAHQVDQEIVDAEKIVESGLDLAINDHERDVFKGVHDHLKEIEVAHAEFDEHVVQLFELLDQYPGEESPEILSLERQVEKEADELDHELEAFLMEVEHHMAVSALRASRHEERALYIVSVLVILNLLLGAFFCVFAARRVTNGLSRVIERISASTNGVNGISAQVSNGSHMIAEGTTESASAMDSTASAVHEISSMIKSNADNSKEASALADESRRTAESGEGQISSLIQSMHDISEGSRKIEEIIKVIDDIAFQTNLLALNAAVEAARAGEQGKGFAVVAEAVRALAQRSADAAKEISQLIQSNAKQAQRGVEAADASSQVLSNIVEKAQKLAVLIDEVASASVEQLQGVEQISGSITQIQQGTQRNAAASEEFSASSQDLSERASELTMLVAELSVERDASDAVELDPAA